MYKLIEREEEWWLYAVRLPKMEHALNLIVSNVDHSVRAYMDMSLDHECQPKWLVEAADYDITPVVTDYKGVTVDDMDEFTANIILDRYDPNYMALRDSHAHQCVTVYDGRFVTMTCCTDGETWGCEVSEGLLGDFIDCGSGSTPQEAIDDVIPRLIQLEQRG